MRKLILFSFLALAGCGVEHKVNNREAALAATGCFKWPEAMRADAGQIDAGGQVPGDGMIATFKHAASVTVDATGHCGDVYDTAVISGTVLHHVPPGSMTPYDGSLYTLWMVTGPDAAGNRMFIGMKGQMAAVGISESDKAT